MKTIKTEVIDDYTIFKEIKIAVIDPEATKNVVKSKLDALPESPEIYARKQHIGLKNKQLRDIQRDSNILWFDKQTLKRKLKLSDTEKLVEAQYQVKWQEVELEINSVQTELTALWSVVKEKKKNLIIYNAVYFEPNPGEVQLPDEQAMALLKLWKEKPASTQITMEGNVIPDYRNREIWNKGTGNWVKMEVVELGIPLSEADILYVNLTDEQQAEVEAQKKINRIALLSPETKITEKEREVDSAATEAAMMKAKLDIQGELKSLGISQTWYQEKVENILSLYL